MCVSVNGDGDGAEATLSDELDYTNHFHYEGSDLVVGRGGWFPAGNMLTVSRSQSSLHSAITLTNK